MKKYLVSGILSVVLTIIILCGVIMGVPRLMDYIDKQLSKQEYRVEELPEYVYEGVHETAINKNSLNCIKMYDKIITATMGDKNEYINRQLPQGMGYVDFNISIHRYHILEFVVDNQTYGIYYPAAFNDVVEQLTGLISKEAPESKNPWRNN